MASEGRLEGVRVLIVDDDTDILEAIDTVMQAEGAETLLVRDGNAAVAVCQDDPPDIVVLDMMLPKRSGFLVLEKIKGHEDSPIVIMVTANEGKRHQAYAESLGVDKYLLKPIPLAILVDEAVRLLDEQDAADDAQEQGGKKRRAGEQGDTDESSSAAGAGSGKTP
ncbi:MAG: response regulator [Phycisphaerales bacterium]|nr:response regulator [Phycisphaerales bacterium]